MDAALDIRGGFLRMCNWTHAVDIEFGSDQHLGPVAFVPTLKFELHAACVNGNPIVIIGIGVIWIGTLVDERLRYCYV